MTGPYSPWAHVSALPEVLVAYDTLEHADAYWVPEHRVILLDHRLSQAGRRSRLAHELAHIDRGDECCGHGPDSARLELRQERGADELAARRLIDLHALADALAWCLDVDEVADCLNVDRKTARVRIRGLTDDERNHIERRLALRDGAA